jgi:hypothetical protein
MYLRTTRVKPDGFTYFFEQPKVGFITSYPTVLNVFDKHTVYIKNSTYSITNYVTSLVKKAI